MKRSNKFDLHWQLVRTTAKDIKDTHSKVKYVMRFLDANKNIHNADRVLNWLKMTKLAYKIKVIFDIAIEYIEHNMDKFTSTKDNTMQLKDLSNDDLLKVYTDLAKRKYGFQYKQVPQAHTHFVDILKKEIDKRGL